MTAFANEWLELHDAHVREWERYTGRRAEDANVSTPDLDAPLILCGSPDEAERLCVRELDAIDGTADIALHDQSRYRLRSVIVTPSARRHAIKAAAVLRALSCSVEVLPAGTDLDAPDLLTLPRAPMFPKIEGPVPPELERDGLRITRADDVAVERVRWLWPGYVPRGKLSLIAGPVGVSKTTVAIAIGATTTQAGRWPDGSHAEVGDILIWSGEDGIADTLLPRLMAHGAELARVHFVRDMIERGKPRPFDPARDADDLVLATARIDNLHYVLVDPVILSVRGDSNTNGDVRRGLFPLVRLAETTGAAVIGVTHFSKGTAGKQPVERVTGSLAFAAAARVVLAVARMPEDQGGGRVLLRAKNNLGPDGSGFRFDIKPTEIAGAETVRIEWGDPIVGTAHDVLAAAEAREEPEEHSAISDACEFIRQVLQESGGSAERKEIVAAAKAAGHYERRVERARSRLNIAVHTSGFGKARRSVWSLPGITDTKVPTKIDSSSGSNSSNDPLLNCYS